MRGPSEGYSSDEKNEYRRLVWKILENTKAMRAVAREHRKVLILDEWRAEEAHFLVKRGYRPENITVANLNVATTARASLSLHVAGVFGVKCKGGDVGEIWTQIAEQGRRVHAIHLDFCSNLSEPLVDTLEAFNGCSAMGPTAFCVNLLRGRESKTNGPFRNAVDSIVGRCGGTMDDARRRSVFHAITCCLLGRQRGMQAASCWGRVTIICKFKRAIDALDGRRTSNSLRRFR